jgi:uncharacterized membrane protein
MSNKAALGWMAAILAAMIAVTAVVYPHLPAVMATHWGANGQPNGSMPRFWGAWMVPLLSIGLAALLWAIPAIDPRRRNYAAFRTTYNAFVVGVVAFLAYVDCISLAWNLGYRLPIGRALAPALGVIFAASGWLLRKARSNWFVGIRTPWTLSSPTVWEKTHRLAAPAFMAAGAVTALGVFWEPLMWLGVLLVVAAAVGAVVYSYFAYEAEQKHRT